MSIYIIRNCSFPVNYRRGPPTAIDFDAGNLFHCGHRVAHLLYSGLEGAPCDRVGELGRLALFHMNDGLSVLV